MSERGGAAAVPEHPDEPEASSHEAPEHEEAEADEWPDEDRASAGPSGRSRFSASRLGPLLLAALMVGAGLTAAIMVTPPADEESLARPGDAEVVLSGGAPVSWDPAVVSDAISAQVLSQVFEGLTALDAATQVRPALAESWAVADDGMRITFTLRADVTFSDGSPIVAEDVRRSWLRVLRSSAPNPLSSLLDDVRGAAAFAGGEVSEAGVGLSADGQTLTVDFERPASYFPAVTAVTTLAVVPPSIEEQLDGPSDGRPFVASGAYVPAGQTGSQLRLVANEAYWAGPPSIGRIVIVTDDGGRSSVDIFEDEAVDWTSISPWDAAWIRYDRSLGPQLRRGDGMAVDFLGFDTTRAPFDDERVRRAVAMAVDWRRISRLEEPDAVEPTSLIPPGIPGHGDEDYLLPHDPDAARAELAAAGYAGGSGFPSVAIATYGVGAATAIAEDLRSELGVDVVVEHRPFDQHSLLLDVDTPPMWTLAWSADYPHAHDFLGLLLRSGSSANVGGWTDRAYDELIDRAAATADPLEQERLYAEAQAIVREQVPLVPLGYGESWSLSREGLRGGEASGVGILRFADLAWQR